MKLKRRLEWSGKRLSAIFEKSVRQVIKAFRFIRIERSNTW